MPVPKVRKSKADSGKSNQINGLYIHSSPPRVLQVSSALVKQAIRSGDIDKLEQLVLDGHGKKLVGEYSADYKTRSFLKTVPGLMSKIALLHDAVNSGRLEELQSVLEEESVDRRKRLVTAKDDVGVGLLHKAVYYDLRDICKYLVEKFPNTIPLRDSEGRTAFHYTAMCKDAPGAQKLLLGAGADSSTLDSRQHSAKYYSAHPQELELPSAQKSAFSPKTAMNQEGLNFKKSNIRIWIHQRNLANLQQVVWEGHGSKLLVEHSNNARIKRFLEAVPHIMGLVKSVHGDVLNDDLEALKDRMGPGIPPVVLSGKDSNGLSPLHKAVGLGKRDIAEHIIEQYPNSVNLTDAEGRTPLHYAALLRDDNRMTDFLLDKGADESALDNKQKTAAYYKTRTSELDPKLLTVVPDCPRTAKDSFISSFDWGLLAASASTEGLQKITRRMAGAITNGKHKAETPEDGEEEEKENGELHSEEEPAKEEEEPQTEEPAEEVNNNNDNEEEEAEAAPESEAAEATEETAEEVAEEVAEEAAAEEVVAEEAAEEAAEETHEEEEAAKEEAEAEEAGETEEAAEAEPEAEAQPEAESEVAEEPEVAEEDGDGDGEGKEEPPPAHEEFEPEGVIEGVVNGENEVETLNEQGQDGAAGASSSEDKPDDEDIAEMVQSGNMERLATLVLNGQGERLIGKTSDNPELQSFLDNVPIYMSKINRIHVAARDGSLRDLQAALDRRKFAIARDQISPNGASPLHAAVTFGNTSIVRYLAGRFPETVQVTDDNGRTPLHYAALLPDNGHYYNLLVHLGADPRTEDKFSRTPEYYRTDQEEFTYRSLLEEFGADASFIEEILKDKVPGDLCSYRRDMDDEEMLGVLERCYTVLHGRRGSNPTSVSASSTQTSLSTASAAIFPRSGGQLLSKHLKRHVFDDIKARMTRLDHHLYDLIWPSVKRLPTEAAFRVSLEQDFPAGIVGPDYYVYEVFAELLEPLVKEHNALDVHHDLGEHPQSKFGEVKEDEQGSVEIDLDLDPHGKFVLAGSLDCTRNLAAFDLPKSLTLGDLEEVERVVTTALLSEQVARALYPSATDEELARGGSGVYYTLNEILEDPSEVRVVLASRGLLIPLWNIPESDRLHGRHWPYGRGVFVSNGDNMAVWINVLDHVRVVTCSPHAKPGNIGLIYSRIYRLISVLDKSLDFRRSPHLGFLSARPTVLGNTLQFSLTLKLPQLIKEPDNLRHLCHVRGLRYFRKANTADVVRVGNTQCLGITEQLVGMARMDARLLGGSSEVPGNNQVDMPFFATEEGRYLASCKPEPLTLGDPLIKGLTEVANKRPEDPIAYLATYLYNFANNSQRQAVHSRGGRAPQENSNSHNLNHVQYQQQHQMALTAAAAPQEAAAAEDDGGNGGGDSVPASIDVVTVEPDEDGDEDDSAFSSTSRDEHGQSMLHFAAARAHGRNALFQLLTETDINVSYRDELYRTARDISVQANLPENTAEIDRYVMHIATKGDTDKLVELLLDGYEHITDIVDENEVPIVEAVAQQKQQDAVSFLQSILAFEEKRERVHHAIRLGSIADVMALLADENDTGSGKLLAIGKNSCGRCTLHIAVLCQQEEIVDYLANTFPDCLKLGDNLERTALHYAMGVEKMETISRVLIKAGARRVMKDLKGRQPTYYFLNKSDILRLQEEEETF